MSKSKSKFRYYYDKATNSYTIQEKVGWFTWRDVAYGFKSEEDVKALLSKSKNGSR